MKLRGSNRVKAFYMKMEILCKANNIRTLRLNGFKLSELVCLSEKHGVKLRDPEKDDPYYKLVIVSSNITAVLKSGEYEIIKYFKKVKSHAV